MDKNFRQPLLQWAYLYVIIRTSPPFPETPPLEMDLARLERAFLALSFRKKAEGMTPPSRCQLVPSPSSFRTIAAPWARAWSLPRAASRDSGTRPQLVQG